ncbi:hypothetical protein GGX14DRAFT_404391 [Mycena pura]|uniref:Uncharacterized protein n=1 Tax=Mycena pura TaxID=153505 RepID=A0AAD6UXW8_9AGAR|nr:hypothetical protein GGX14DRAFT_404391 [Mycena pura]
MNFLLIPLFLATLLLQFKFSAVLPTSLPREDPFPQTELRQWTRLLIIVHSPSLRRSRPHRVIPTPPHAPTPSLRNMRSVSTAPTRKTRMARSREIMTVCPGSLTRALVDLLTWSQLKLAEYLSFCFAAGFHIKNVTIAGSFQGAGSSGAAASSGASPTAGSSQAKTGAGVAAEAPFKLVAISWFAFGVLSVALFEITL